MDFDATVPSVRADVESINGLLEREGVGNELAQADDSTAEAGNAGRPRVSVPVDELQIDLEKLSATAPSVRGVGVRG